MAIRELVVKRCSVSISSSVVKYNSLRKLSLYDVRLDENMLQTLVNKCPLLVSVILEYCQGLEKIKSDSLMVLKIFYSEIGEIDALNLASLEYAGNQIPELRIARNSSQLEHSKIVFVCHDNVNAALFLRSTRQICNCTTETEECPTFVDALLWSCRPKRLNLQSTSAMFTHFLNRLIYMKNSSNSTSHGKEPWHSQLKEVKAFDVKNQPLELGSGETGSKQPHGE
ncbi:hypothetical protein CQW23_22670 [Capsicum baccatum]|uniref:At1g61320/AtMIF1 LRR domain-containing protein n=1 Tax=Capsicum baccatum TaxID=33114 RepID=A0A2G2W1I2_CAPBA|nr:hypothetical protein CQW23_22670 [Capsicum baccatum]